MHQAEPPNEDVQNIHELVVRDYQSEISKADTHSHRGSLGCLASVSESIIKK